MFDITMLNRIPFTVVSFPFVSEYSLSMMYFFFLGYNTFMFGKIAPVFLSGPINR